MESNCLPGKELIILLVYNTSPVPVVSFLAFTVWCSLGDCIQYNEQSNWCLLFHFPTPILWWLMEKYVSDLFILIPHRWQLMINLNITGNGVLQQTWLLFLTWLIIFGGRGTKNNVWSRSVSVIRYKDSYSVQTPQKGIFSISGLLGIEFLVQKECIDSWLFLWLR
jgi:hypothetical protein